MKKRYILPAVLLGSAGAVYKYLNPEKSNSKDSEEKKVEAKILDKPKKIPFIKRRRSSSKVSRYLLKTLNGIDNNRLLFIEIKPIKRKLRDKLLEKLAELKTDEPENEIWVADYFKQNYSRGYIHVLVNKKAAFFLANLDEVAKAKVSARDTAGKLIGKSLSKISARFPSIENYILGPTLDIYAPLKETREISNFGVVEDGSLYRGGMLVGDSNYDQLTDFNIQTVVNLKIEDSAVEFVEEQNSLIKRNITLHYLPMPNVSAPTLLQTMEFLTLVYDAESKPVYVHCHRGADRTGTMVAIFRVTQGMSAAQAVIEAKKFNIAEGYHVEKINLIYKFEELWAKWKSENILPNNLENFDFMSLIDEDEEDDELDEKIEELLEDEDKSLKEIENNDLDKNITTEVKIDVEPEALTNDEVNKKASKEINDSPDKASEVKTDGKPEVLNNNEKTQKESDDKKPKSKKKKGNKKKK